MRDGLEEIATSAVDLGKRDERAAEIVSAPRAEFEGREVEEERALGVGAGAFGEVAGGDDEIVARGWAAVGAFPAGGVPLVEEAGEGWVDGDATGDLGFRSFEIEGAQRVEVRLIVAPAQARGLAVAEAGEALEGVQEAAVFEEANVGDELLHLFAGEYGVRSEVRVLVDLLGKDALREHTRSRDDELIGDRRSEHRRQDGVDVPDGARSERRLFPEFEDEIADVAGADFFELHRPQNRHRVLEAVRVVARRLQPQGPPVRHPASGVGGDGQRPGEYAAIDRPLPSLDPAFEMLEESSGLSLFTWAVGRRCPAPSARLVLVASPQLRALPVETAHRSSALSR